MTTQATKGNGWSIVVLAGIGLAGYIYLSERRPDSPPKAATPAAPTESQEKSMAWVLVQDEVKKRLVSPGSADFGSIMGGDFQNSDRTVTALGSGRFRVNGWVDSQNRMGAKLRADFAATVEHRADGWYMVEGPVLTER